jgi:hypothetical protein
MELSELPGVLSVSPNAEHKTVKVAFQDPATEQGIVDLLEEINYPVTS